MQSPLLCESRVREAQKKLGGAESESKDYTGVYRVQAAQLQHHEEQEKRPRQARNDEVLQILQETHSSQRNQVTRGRILWQTI